MPQPPANTVWKFDVKTQVWSAISKSTGQAVQQLHDGIKYVLGTGYLPTGWEVSTTPSHHILQPLRIRSRCKCAMFRFSFAVGRPARLNSSQQALTCRIKCPLFLGRLTHNVCCNHLA
jgi:hypothetical protein